MNPNAVDDMDGPGSRGMGSGGPGKAALERAGIFYPLQPSIPVHGILLQNRHPKA